MSRDPERSPASSGALVRLRRQRAWEYGALAAVIASGIGLSGWWAARVPIFCSPDEDVHFDYVVSLVTAGRPLLASEKPVTETAVVVYMPHSHPYTHHLAMATGTFMMRGDERSRVPPGYGSEAYFSTVSRSAPDPGQLPHRNPYLINGYPIGYYGLSALWSGAWSRIYPGPVGLFFAARAFSVALFGAGLFLWWKVFRQQGCPPWRALGVLAIVAWLPFSSFVSSYVQADNLGFAAVPLCLWLAMRAAVTMPSPRDLTATGVALALLLLAKYHLFLAVFLPVAALLAVAHQRSPRRNWPALALMVLGPCLIAAELQLWISSGGPALHYYNVTLRRETRLPQWGVALYVVRELRALLHDFFHVDGHTFATFWYRFCWEDVSYGWSKRRMDLVLAALQGGMVTMLVLLIVRWQQVVTTLGALRRRGRGDRAVRLLLRNPLLNSYLVFSALMWAIFVYFANAQIAQGRHWFAMLPAILWAAVEYSPRALASRRAGRWLSRAVLGTLLVLALVGSLSTLRSLEARYYGPPPPPTAGATTAAPEGVDQPSPRPAI